MSRYFVHRSDANAEKVYAALEACGVHVERIGRPVDAILYVEGQVALLEQRLETRGVTIEWIRDSSHALPEWGETILAEIKTAKGKTRSKAQAAFLKRWPGPILVLRSE